MTDPITFHLSNESGFVRAGIDPVHKDEFMAVSKGGTLAFAAPDRRAVFLCVYPSGGMETFISVLTHETLHVALGEDDAGTGCASLGLDNIEDESRFPISGWR